MRTNKTEQFGRVITGVGSGKKVPVWTFVTFPRSLLPNILMNFFSYHRLRCVTLH